MFLLEVFQLFGLVGLLVQTFVAWIFVALLVSMERQDSSREAFRHFLRGFFALALSLTVLSARFFRTHDVTYTSNLWSDGQLLPTLCYSLYMALKIEFGLRVVIGSHLLVGTPVPRWLLRAHLPAVVASTLPPFFVPDIDPLLAVQAPAMIAVALLALRGLRPYRERTTGIRFIRIALTGLCLSWSVHALAVFADGKWGAQYWLQMNSFVDLGVQLLLGVGLVVSIFQIAHRKQLAAERERERLQQSIARDQKLTALGGVVSGVAHELNNPLTVILGYAELQQESPDQENAAIILEQAQRCRGIVRNLSALAGQSVQRRTPNNLSEMLDRCIRGLPPKLTRDNRRVEVDCPQDLELVCDGFGIEQVVVNLVANALQATPPDSTVRVYAQRQNGHIQLRVTDEGPGVPEEFKCQLFDPFFTTKQPGQGTGLGLSIAHAIVRQHDGTIEVESSRGTGDESSSGAAFSVTLPAVSAEPETSAPSTPPPARNRQLLVVDDDRAVRSVMCQVAQRRGWDAVASPSAEEALALDWGNVDAVLCDLRMPGMGGAGLHDELTASDPSRLERVVFFTGDLASSDAIQFSDRCTRPLLEKPVDYDELFALLAHTVSSNETQPKVPPA